MLQLYCKIQFYEQFKFQSKKKIKNGKKRLARFFCSLNFEIYTSLFNLLKSDNFVVNF